MQGATYKTSGLNFCMHKPSLNLDGVVHKVLQNRNLDAFRDAFSFFCYVLLLFFEGATFEKIYNE